MQLDCFLSHNGFSAIGTFEYIGKWRVATMTYQNDTRLTHIGQVAAQNADVGFDDLRRIVNHRWESFTGGDTTPGNDTLIVGFGHQDNVPNPAYDRMNNKLIEEKLHDSDSSEVYLYDSVYRVTDPGASDYRGIVGAFKRGTLNAGKTDTTTVTTRPGQRQNDDWTLDGLGNWATNPYTDQGIAAVTETRDHTDFNEINKRTIAGNNTTQTLDKNGNILDTGKQIVGGKIFKGGKIRMVWDSLNRLRQIYENNDTPGTTGDDTLIQELTYDCHNRRMRMVTTNNTTGLNGTIDYYYHGNRVVEEHDASDVIIRQYTYGNYIHEVWTLDDRTGGITIAQLNDGTGGERKFYHQNTLYSTFALTDETGVIAEAYQYDAYGLPTVWSGAGVDTVWFTNDDVVSTTTNGAPVSAVGNRRLYTGHYFESLDLVESGLENDVNRWRSPDLGRYVSRDPIGYNGGINLYEYVASSPTYYLDADGKILGLVAAGLVAYGIITVTEQDEPSVVQQVSGPGVYHQEKYFETRWKGWYQHIQHDVESRIWDKAVDHFMSVCKKGKPECIGHSGTVDILMTNAGVRYERGVQNYRTRTAQTPKRDYDTAYGDKAQGGWDAIYELGAFDWVVKEKKVSVHYNCHPDWSVPEGCCLCEYSGFYTLQVHDIVGQKGLGVPTANIIRAQWKKWFKGSWVECP